jgi:uncharacterized protein YndB with AHSA1/START domain
MSIDLKFSVLIDSPVETVCQAVSDLPRMPEWFSVEEVRNITGPLAVGTSFEVVTETMGSRRVMAYQVEQYEPCKRFVYHSRGKYPSAIDLALDDQGEATRLTLRFQLKVNSLAARMLRDPLRKQLVADLSRLAEQVEQAS